MSVDPALRRALQRYSDAALRTAVEAAHASGDHDLAAIGLVEQARRAAAHVTVTDEGIEAPGHWSDR